MPFSEPQQDRTTLSPLNYLRLAPSVDLVLIWWAFIPSVWRLAIGLQRARPHFAEVLKNSVRHAGTIALLSVLHLPLGNMSFFFSPCPSYGTIKYVVNSNQNNTEAPSNPVDTPTTIPMHERRWIDIEPSEQTLAAYDLSKKVISLLRHNQTVQQEKDGAIEFYRIKFHLRNHSSQVQHWSDERWKSCLVARGGSKRRYQYCSYNSRRILYLRALQGHSVNNLIDPTLQDNVVIGTGIFPYIYPRRMHIQSSLYYQQWIDTWRSRFEQKTDSILLAH